MENRGDATGLPVMTQLPPAYFWLWERDKHPCREGCFLSFLPPSAEDTPPWSLSSVLLQLLEICCLAAASGLVLHSNLLRTSCPSLCDPLDCTCQAPLSMGFSRQEYWSGLSCPPAGDLPDPGVEPTSLISPALAGGYFTASATWEALIISHTNIFKILYLICY